VDYERKQYHYEENCTIQVNSLPSHGPSFVGLHHNTVRGAAGGCILIAELLREKGYAR
jgi:aspartate-semialdehyde dehydrogenase